MEKGIDFGHAITIHKSQGRTTKNVFFDANTISKSPQPKIMENGVQISEERQSLGYVGMSRASENLFVNMGWVSFKDENTAPTPTQTSEQQTPVPQQTSNMSFKFNGILVILRPDGSIVGQDGKAITDPMMINRAELARDNRLGTLRVKSPYFVLSNNKILGATEKTYAKEFTFDEAKTKEIIDNASPYKTC